MKIIYSEEIAAIAYIRQSEERDDKEDISEQTQLTKIKQYCEFNNWKLVKVFKDIDYSGFRISYKKRPGMMEALNYLQTNPKVKKFVIFNLSRLTRRRKDFLMIHETLTSQSVDLCSASELLDFSTPTGRLVAGVLVDFNEYHSDNLSDVTSASKKTNAEKGRWNGGPAPFGFIRVDEVFKASEHAHIPILAFEMAKDGKGPHTIAKTLNYKKWYTKTGVKWSARRVRYMLTNPTYAAMQYWDGTYYPLKGFDLLVTWEDFNFIQKTLFGEHHAWKGRQRQLLSSILLCPVCGSKMHSRKTNNKKTRRYVCNNKYDVLGCSSPVFDLPSLNNSVINLISDISNTRYTKTDLLQKMSQRGDNEPVLESIQNEYDLLEKAKQKVFDDFYVYQKLDENTFVKIMKRYDDKQNELRKKLAVIPIPKSTKYGDLDQLVSEIPLMLKENLDENNKRVVTELIIEKIIPDKTTKVYFKWGEVRELKCTTYTKRKTNVVYF